MWNILDYIELFKDLLTVFQNNLWIPFVSWTFKNLCHSSDPLRGKKHLAQEIIVYYNKLVCSAAMLEKSDWGLYWVWGGTALGTGWFAYIWLQANSKVTSNNVESHSTFRKKKYAILEDILLKRGFLESPRKICQH